MTNVINHGGLTIATGLYDLVNDEILADGSISADRFWSGLDEAVHQLAPKEPRPLAKTDQIAKTN